MWKKGKYEDPWGCGNRAVNIYPVHKIKQSIGICLRVRPLCLGIWEVLTNCSSKSSLRRNYGADFIRLSLKTILILSNLWSNFEIGLPVNVRTDRVDQMDSCLPADVLLQLFFTHSTRHVRRGVKQRYKIDSLYYFWLPHKAILRKLDNNRPSTTISKISGAEKRRHWQTTTVLHKNIPTYETRRYLTQMSIDPPRCKSVKANQSSPWAIWQKSRKKPNVGLTFFTRLLHREFFPPALATSFRYAV